MQSMEERPRRRSIVIQRRGSSRHTLVTVVCRRRRPLELAQRGLQAGNACLQVLNLLLLVPTRPVDLRQSQDGAPRPLQLQPDVGSCGSHVLDLEGTICAGLCGRGRGCRVDEALEEVVEVGEDVEGGRRREALRRGSRSRSLQSWRRSARRWERGARRRRGVGCGSSRHDKCR
jgi:hypothetical protein